MSVPVGSKVVWARARSSRGREPLGTEKGDIRPVGVSLGVGVGTAASGQTLEPRSPGSPQPTSGRVQVSGSPRVGSCAQS